MTDQPPLPCPVKGCAWRGPDPTGCPMHEADAAWERQPTPMPDHVVVRRQTRHSR